MQTVSGDSSFMESELGCSLVDLIFLFFSETKIDGSFPDSQFQVKGFRLSRSDRKAGGGGLMIYVRSDIHLVKVKHWKE